MTNDITQYQNTLILMIRVLSRAVFLFIGGIIASFIFSSELIATNGDNLWWLAFIILGCIFIMLLIISILMVFAVPKFKQQQKETDDANKLMRETILGSKVVKAFNLQSEQIEVFDKQNKSLRRTSTLAQTIIFVLMPVIQFFVQVSIVILLIVAGVLMQNSSAQTSSTPVVLVFIQMVSLIVMGFMMSSMTIVNMAQTKASTNRIHEVFNTIPSIAKNESSNYIENSDVVFKNVNFKYIDSKDSLSVLQDISFEAKAGEMIGIIGPTGSGKTTLVNLIMRNYDVDEGEVSISGFNIKDINYDSLRDSIRYVPQKNVLFAGTIRSNLLYGKNDATDEELVLAAKRAQALEFIQKKENYFDSVVDQRGGNFSGGQKQRLSIARALVKVPKILILDDSTSALDMITEAKVQENIRKLENTTTFLVGQRISAISRADKIIVLDQGKMVGYGTHNQLLKKCALYKEIAKSQAIGVEE